MVLCRLINVLGKMDLRIFFQRTATSATNDVAEQKNKDSSCSQAFDKPNNSESQADSDNGADDISMNVDIDNCARESDQGRNVIADTTIGARRGTVPCPVISKCRAM